jgi:Lar family restriction alleviation protein
MDDNGKSATDQPSHGPMGTAGELLPCPFCGEEAEVLRDGDGDYYVACTICAASVASNGLRHHAITAWNRRP